MCKWIDTVRGVARLFKRVHTLELGYVLSVAVLFFKVPLPIRNSIFKLFLFFLIHMGWTKWKAIFQTICSLYASIWLTHIEIKVWFYGIFFRALMAKNSRKWLVRHIKLKKWPAIIKIWIFSSDSVLLDLNRIFSLNMFGMKINYSTRCYSNLKWILDTKLK